MGDIESLMELMKSTDALRTKYLKNNQFNLLNSITVDFASSPNAALAPKTYSTTQIKNKTRSLEKCWRRVHKEVQALRNTADAADVEHKKGKPPTSVLFPCSLLYLLTFWAAPIERALADQSLSFFFCLSPTADFPFYELGASLWVASDSVQKGAVREHGTPGRAAEGAQPALPCATPPPPQDERQDKREDDTSGSEAESDPHPRQSLAEVYSIRPGGGPPHVGGDKAPFAP